MFCGIWCFCVLVAKKRLPQKHQNTKKYTPKNSRTNNNPMKKIFAFAFFSFCVLPLAYSQIKATKATSQKTVAGMGGVFMKYVIVFKSKKNAVVEIDSVRSVADSSKMTHYVNKNEISFGFALLPPAKCKTCVETTPPQPNMTQGVIIYYRKGDKKLTCKVKKFKELEVVMQP
jgi:hypothetical protein